MTKAGARPFLHAGFATAALLLFAAAGCLRAGSDRDWHAQPLHRYYGTEAAVGKTVPLGRLGRPSRGG
jgi:hypothetical protein